MKIYNNLKEFEPLEYAVVTSGTFDGVHIGHKKIIDRVNKITDNSKGESVIITFWPHPRLVLYPEEKDLKLLTTFEEKASMLRELGIDHLIKIKFTKEFSRTTSEEFIKNILVKKIGTKKLVIGYDHRFGRNREGSFENLKKDAPKYGFEVEEIPRQDIDDVAVSSTKIRKSLLKGDIKTGNEYLGRPYLITGEVVSGNKIGRSMGFPTANIKVSNRNKLIPADGIYAVKVFVEEKEYKGMLYIGNRPTLNVSDKTIEVNIFDFNEEIYDKSISIYFYEQIRDDVKFNSLEELRLQLKKDRETVTQLLNW